MMLDKFSWTGCRFRDYWPDFEYLQHNNHGLNPIYSPIRANLAVNLGYGPVLNQCVSCGQSQTLVGEFG